MSDRPMRAISVRQPWAWAILKGGKNVENRPRRDPWRSAVGQRVWVHASLTLGAVGDFQRVKQLVGGKPADDDLTMTPGAVVGSVRITGVHIGESKKMGGCDGCSPWAVSGSWHLVLAEPEPLTTPILCRGALGLFVPDLSSLAVSR